MPDHLPARLAAGSVALSLLGWIGGVSRGRMDTGFAGDVYGLAGNTALTDAGLSPDLRGALAADALVDERLAAGTHTFIWRGRDDSGQAVGSGTYLVLIRGAGQAISHKLSLLK